MNRFQFSIISFCFVTALVAVNSAVAEEKKEAPLAGPHKEFVCEECHGVHEEKLPTIAQSVCFNCHPDRTGEDSHPTDIKYNGEPPEGLPLSKDGKITCSTCHVLHERSPSAGLLRKKFDTLCSTCHFPTKADSGGAEKGERDTAAKRSSGDD